MKAVSADVTRVHYYISQTLPKGISALHNLRVLDLEGNKLEYLATEISKLHWQPCVVTCSMEENNFHFTQLHSPPSTPLHSPPLPPLSSTPFPPLHSPPPYSPSLSLHTQFPGYLRELQKLNVQSNRITNLPRGLGCVLTIVNNPPIRSTQYIY